MRPSSLLRLLLLLTFSLCLPSCSFSSPASSLPEELRLIKRAGIPTAPDQLQASLPPAEQNAAPLYDQLVTLFQTKPSMGETAGISRRGLTAAQATKLRKAFQDRPDIGRLIHQAVARPQCVFVLKWSQGTSMVFTENVTMRAAARYLSAESALQLYDGKPLEAIKTQALGFHLARHAASTPRLIADLVADALDAITLYGMERILYVAGDKPGVAQAVLETLNTEYRPHSLSHALHGEIVLPRIETEKYRKSSPEAYERSQKQEAVLARQSGDSISLPALSPNDKTHWNQFLDRTEAATLRTLRLVIVAADRPYPEATLSFQHIGADLQAHQQDAAYATPRLVFPVYVQSLKDRARLLAKATTVRATAAVFAWKVRHGAFPGKLADALPQVPADPWTGKPLRYQKTSDGFVIYSVGPTGKFDGRTPTGNPDMMESYFRYPMPANIP